MDPISIAAYNQSIISTLLTLQNWIDKQPKSDLPETSRKECRQITEQICADLRKRPSAQNQENVFAATVKIRGLFHRVRNRRDLNKALDEYRRLKSRLVPEQAPEIRIRAPLRSETGTGRKPDSPATSDGLTDAPTPVTERRLGLIPQVITESAECDIIFVHGLGGHPRETWTSSSGSAGTGFWPRTLLLHDLNSDAYPRCSIYVYGYDMLTLPEDQQSMNKLGGDLVIALRHHARQLTAAKCVVIVAHSLGGTLVQYALSQWFKLSKLPKLGLIFFGTPGHFSSLSAKQARIKAIMSTMIPDGMSRRDFEIFSERFSSNTSIELPPDFESMLGSRSSGIPVFSMFEEQPTVTPTGPLKLVEPFMINPSLRGDFKLVPGNHETMCKFESRDEYGYLQFTRALKAIIDQLQIQPSSSSLSVNTIFHHRRKSSAPYTPSSPLEQSGNEDIESSPRASAASHRSKLGTASDITQDLEQVDVPEEFSRLRPRFEVPLATWVSQKGSNEKLGLWVRDSDEFKDWMKTRSSSLLVLLGPSGSGKTMAAESVLEGFRDSKGEEGTNFNTCTIQLFLSSSDCKNCTVYNMLCALIAQIVDQNTELIKHVVQTIGHEPKKRAIAEEDLFIILRALLRDTCWKRIWCVIDGLDEAAQFVTVSDEQSRLRDRANIDKASTDTLLRTLASIPTLRMVITSVVAPFAITLKTLTRHFKDAIYFAIVKSRGYQTVFDEHLADKQHSISSIKRVSDSLRLLCKILSASEEKSFRHADLILNNAGERLSSQKMSISDDEDISVEDQDMIYFSILTDNQQLTPDLLMHISFIARTEEPISRDSLELLLNLREECPLDLDLDSALANLDRNIGAWMSKGQWLLLLATESRILFRSDEFRRFCLSHIHFDEEEQVFTVDPGPTDSESLIQTDMKIHLQIARACLNLLLLEHNGRAVSTEVVESPASTIPFLAYSRDCWGRHAFRAGDQATALSGLIRKLFELRALGSGQGSDFKASDERYLLEILSKENLSVNIRDLFHGDQLSHLTIKGTTDAITDYASLRSNIETIRSLENVSGSGSAKGSNNKLSRLNVALVIRSGDEKKAKQLLSKADLEMKDTMLEISLRSRCSEMTKLIFENIASRAYLGKTLKSLDWAVSMQDHIAVERMAMRTTLFDLQSSLLIAVRAAERVFCEILLSHKADPNERDRGGQTALHIASAKGYLDIVGLLLTWRANPERRDKKERTALHCATEYGHADVVKYLLEHSTLREETDQHGRTPLFIACAQGYRRTVSHLLSSGSKLSHTDKENRTVLHAASHKGDLDLVEILLKAGVKPTLKDRLGRTALHEAASKGFGPIVHGLISAGANPAEGDNYGRTSLHLACATRNAPELVARDLIRLGADPRAKINELSRRHAGETPMHVAAQSGTARLMRVLLDAGAVVDQKVEMLVHSSRTSKEEKRAKMALLQQRRTPTIWD